MGDTYQEVYPKTSDAVDALVKKTLEPLMPKSQGPSKLKKEFGTPASRDSGGDEAHCAAEVKQAAKLHRAPKCAPDTP